MASKNYNLKKGLALGSNLHAKYAVLIGDEEIGSQIVTVKCLATREEKKVRIDDFLGILV